MQKLSAYKQNSPNQLLRDWLKKNGINISQCNRECGYRSNYVMLLTSPTNPRPMTFEFVGRLLVTYGADGPAIVIAQALRAEQTNGNGKAIK